MKLASSRLVALCIAASPALAQLSPPGGPIAPTMKPIAQLEPRTALTAANTPGDADSVFRITQPGSYYLTGDLLGESGKAGIEIAAGHVTIDLTGFSLRGVPGSLSGIRVASSSAGNLTIRNGVVTAWGQDGLDLSIGDNIGCIIENIHATHNTRAGIDAPDRSIVINTLVRSNGSNGISTGIRSRIEGCIAENNAFSGISAGFGSAVRACSSTQNDGDGISTANASHITDCSTIENGGDGIRVPNNCIIRGNLCDGNGFFSGDGAGIHVSGLGCRIEDNNVSRNDRGLDVDAAGNFIARNSASSNTTNYSITGTQTIGPILSTPGTITSSSPWANFSF
jgi:parallel beta-helix repeat protein